MRLNFGPIEFDTKGLPRAFSIRAEPSYSTERQVDVYILLDGYTRSVVAKWADRLGVEVVDLPLYQSRPGGEWVQTWEAVCEAPGCKLRVWTSRTVEAPAEPIPVVETVLHWPAPGLQTTTSCDGEPLTREAFADRAPDVTCPQCRELLGSEPVGGKSTALPAIVKAAADPDTVLWAVDPKAAPECPCGCNAARCFCTDPRTCSCKPACPVCDQDGGE